MADEPSKVVKITHGILETLAIIIGFGLTMISLMAIVGLLTDSFWARAGVSALVAIGLPLLITDRLLPEDDATAGRGLFTDVLAILWLGFGLVWMGVGINFTHGMLQAEADRLGEQGMGWASGGVEWLIGPAPSARAERSAVAAGDAAGDAGASDTSPVDAGSPVDDAGDVATADGGPADAADASDTADPEHADQDESDNGEMTTVELFREMSPAVVSIEIEKQSRGRRGQAGGTGFIISDDGIVVTNHHVINGGESIEISLHDGTVIDEVWTLAESSRLDLALLQIGTDKELVVAQLGDSDTVEVGQRVVAIGNPLGLDYTMTDGLVSARRVWRGRKMIQMSVPISPGNSGGPLFNMAGEVVGINTAGLGNAFNRAENLNLAVPVNELKNNLIESTYPQKRKFGEKSRKGSW
jgi:serine protease Do